MGTIIELSSCTDDVLEIFENLKESVSDDLCERTEGNSFIQHIESVGKIDEELLDFLYHSDFLCQITEQSLPFIKQLYEENARIDWFYLVQKVYEEVSECADEYVKLVKQSFFHGMDVSHVEQLLEDAGWTDISVFQEKISSYIGNSIPNETEENIQKRQNIIEEQYEKMSVLLQESYEIIRSDKKQEMSLKMQIISLQKSQDFTNKLLERERKKNTDFFLRIQELEDENVLLQKNVEMLKEALQTEEDHERQQSEEAEDTFFEAEYENTSSYNNFDDVWENALNDDDADIEATDPEQDDEDYSEVSFVTEEETVQEVESDEMEDIAASELPADPYQYSDVKNITSDEEVIKKKSKWFLGHLFGYSKKNFLKLPRVGQEGKIFIKMMELHFSLEQTRIVKEGLIACGDKVPCFDLYKLVCKKPSKDELVDFFGNFKEESLDE